MTTNQPYDPSYDVKRLRESGLLVDRPLSVILYRESGGGANHYADHAPGEPRPTLTMCGRDVSGLKRAAFFPVGDPRGGVVYSKACDVCKEMLAV